MDDDRWSIAALRNVNSLAASVALKGKHLLSQLPFPYFFRAGKSLTIKPFALDDAFADVSEHCILKKTKLPIIK